MDTADNGNKEISSSGGMISINMPEIGSLSQINVPFKT